MFFRREPVPSKANHGPSLAPSWPPPSVPQGSAGALERQTGKGNRDRSGDGMKLKVRP